MSDTDNTIMSRIDSGSLVRTPGVRYNPKQVVDMNGNPIAMGNTDPNVIGADDSYDFRFRGDEDYPDVPQEVKNAEKNYILPMARVIANALDITVLDETAYERIVKALRSRSVFVVLNLYKATVDAGVGSWYGLMIMCKKHPIVMVHYRLHIATGKIGIVKIKLWDGRNSRYLLLGDPQGRSFLSSEKATASIIDYLRNEGVVPTL